jgi:hypothetical protein
VVARRDQVGSAYLCRQLTPDIDRGAGRVFVADEADPDIRRYAMP